MKPFELEIWGKNYPGEFKGFQLITVYSYDKDSALATGRSLYPHADVVCSFDKEYYDACY